MPNPILRYLFLLATPLCFACLNTLKEDDKEKSEVKQIAEGIEGKIEAFDNLPEAVLFVDKIRENAVKKRAAADKATTAVSNATDILRAAQKGFKDALTAYRNKADNALASLGEARKQCLEKIKELEKRIKPCRPLNNEDRRKAIALIQEKLNEISPEHFNLDTEKQQLNTALEALEAAEKGLTAKKAVQENRLKEAQAAEKKAEAAEAALKAKAQKIMDKEEEDDDDDDE